MRNMRILVVALLAAALGIGAALAGGNSKNPAPAGKAVATGPAVELVGIVGDDIPDTNNSNGTYTAIEDFDLADITIAGIAINIKPGGKPEAHMLVGYEMKTIPATPARKDKKGRVVEAAKPERKVADTSKPVLKGYVPQEAIGVDNVRYTSFTYMSEAKRDVAEGTIKGMVTVSPGGGILIKANGIPLGIAQLIKSPAGPLRLKVFHCKVEAPKAEPTPTTSANPAPTSK